MLRMSKAVLRHVAEGKTADEVLSELGVGWTLQFQNSEVMIFKFYRYDDTL